jgi:hypothetical protein
MLAVLALACAAAGGAERDHAQDRHAPPNIVLFIADDMGIEDTDASAFERRGIWLRNSNFSRMSWTLGEKPSS